MKTQKIIASILNITLVAAFGFVTFAGTGERLTSSIPFSFTAGDRQLPAGDYLVRLSDNRGLVTLINKATNASVNIQSRGMVIPAASPTTLRFHKYGEQYFLENIVAGSEGAELVASKAERTIEKGSRLSQITWNREIISIKASRS